MPGIYSYPLISSPTELRNGQQYERQTLESVEVFVKEVNTTTKENESQFWEQAALIFGLLIASTASLLLIVGDRREWVLTPCLYNFVEQNRATTQIIVQLLSNALAFFQIAVLSSLINQATRIRLKKSKASMDALRFWTKLCTPSISWHLPPKYLLPLLLFWTLTRFPSALWAGALSPIATSAVYISTILTPSYDNSSLIHEYPSQYGRAGQGEIRSPKGAFSYNVGMAMEGALLSTASAASTVDGTPRMHFKLDNTGFSYIGRSYGTGAGVGLTDDKIAQKSLTNSYAYQEIGYNAKVTCIYNSSSDFILAEVDAPLFQARGKLPNSVEDEISTYVSWSNSSIVAIGVAGAQTKGIKYLGIAAGSDYIALNATQCSIDYAPTLFNISVSVENKTISVVPISPGRDINPAGNIAHTTTRQFELISNDQTILYQSLVGNSFMSSISNYNISQQVNSTAPISDARIALTGLTNSISAMVDDMLVAYASAQLMVSNQSTATETVVSQAALKIGNSIYIIAMFILNLVILMIVVEEAIRNRLWKGLGEWNYMDIGMVVVSAWEGGNISAVASGTAGKEMVIQKYGQR